MCRPPFPLLHSLWFLSHRSFRVVLHIMQHPQSVALVKVRQVHDRNGAGADDLTMAEFANGLRIAHPARDWSWYSTPVTVVPPADPVAVFDDLGAETRCLESKAGMQLNARVVARKAAAWLALLANARTDARSTTILCGVSNKSQAIGIAMPPHGRWLGDLRNALTAELSGCWPPLPDGSVRVSLVPVVDDLRGMELWAVPEQASSIVER